MSAIIIDNEIVHYEVLGRGRPLFFLHGWVGSWRYWIPAMQNTSTSFRAYALDFWGFGDTANHTSQYSIDDQVNLLDRFMSEMGISKVGLIGHGLGAIASLLFANKFPHAIDRIMAICLPFEDRNVNPRLRNSKPEDLADWLLSSNPTSEAVRVEVPKVDHQSLLVSLDSIAKLDLYEQFLQLTIPSLFIFGQNDPAISHPAQKSLIGAAEHTHQIVFDRAGHFPMLDQANKFNRLLIDFLALNSGESPRQLQLKEEWKRRVR
jgi:pimeloyl-ACP methyl ester carboxylesterase